MPRQIVSRVVLYQVTVVAGGNTAHYYEDWDELSRHLNEAIDLEIDIGREWRIRCVLVAAEEIQRFGPTTHEQRNPLVL